MESSLKQALIAFLLVFLSIYATKPKWLFEDRTGQRRQFGLGYTRDQEKRTLFDMTVVTVILGIIIGSIF